MKAAVSGQDRRAGQRDKLVACAQAAIAREGLTGIRARSLAECTGCAVGAIYNLVKDLDELVLLVSRRTMADLDRRLDEAAGRKGQRRSVEDLLVSWALAYRAFAGANRNLWRALFEFRLSTARDLPEWFAIDQMKLFVRLEEALAVLLPDLDMSERRLRARTLFSAVHGIVALGLEEKLIAMPPVALDAELEAFVRAYVEGLRAS